MSEHQARAKVAEIMASGRGTIATPIHVKDGYWVVQCGYICPVTGDVGQPIFIREYRSPLEWNSPWRQPCIT